MRVLLIEDSGALAKQIKDVLEDAHHDAEVVFTLPDAMDYLDDNGVPDCVILDLSMVCLGVPEEFREQARGGILSGWVWFHRVAVVQHPALAGRTIIYTAHENELHQAFPKEDHKEEYCGVTVLAKGKDDVEVTSKGRREIVRTVEQIAGRR